MILQINQLLLIHQYHRLLLIDIYSQHNILIL
nr:MAG TPA: hypothetical protein [Caudoviricetes sp.]DAJ24171.1 MAG TPA: hypothetical protein [Caudoviricetes sp.]DAR97031.1 MAG TPA: hypothetical protein [Caudoviricetes sp.]